MEEWFRRFKRKGRCFQRIIALLLAVCVSAGSLPCTGYAETVGRKPEAEAYLGEQEIYGTGSGSNGEISQSDEQLDIVHGFGTKIKEKKQKKIKVKVNQGNQDGKSWNLQMVQAGTEEKQEKNGRTIKVAVIDSGINFSTDLPVVVRKNFIPGDERSVLYEDPSGHGTAVAGIIAALDNEEGITGINPCVELYSARVLDAKLEAPIERIVEAIDWAVEQEVDIINMSFGITRNVEELEAAVERAAEAGILLIAASGNGETIAYPAAYDEVIAVGSVTAEGIAAEQSAGGEALELMAPGENILSSAVFGGVTGVSGTSMAAPHVAGAASVLMELNPEMPADYIRMLLNYSANLYGAPDEYGNGVLDLAYAVEINDKFKKLYEKHIAKEEKNEKKKEKQKEKFWGEVLKTIPENEKAVETFTDLDVVEGMWLKDRKEETDGHYSASNKIHEDFVLQGMRDNQLSFSSAQMQILMFSCGYPDTGLSGAGKPYHGHLWEYEKDTCGDYVPIGESNYVANYIFLTKAALAYGDGDSIARGNVYPKDYTHFIGDITPERLGKKTWEQVFADLKEKMKVEVPVTDENKKLFLYGMSLHLITDVYAHSTFSWNGSRWTRVGHNKDVWNLDCDNPSYIPYRWIAAQYAANRVLWKAYNGQPGNILDFFNAPSVYNGYYVGNLAAYAQMADPETYSHYTNSLPCGDLWYNVQDETKISYSGKFKECGRTYNRPILKASED